MNHKNHDMDMSNIQSAPRKRQSPQRHARCSTPTVEKDRHSRNTTYYFEHSLLLLLLKLLLLFPHDDDDDDDDDNAKNTTVSTLRVRNRHLQKPQRIGTWEHVVVLQQQQQQQRRLLFHMSSFFFLCYFIHLNPLMSLLCEAFTVTTTTVIGGDRNRHYDNIHSDHHHHQPARIFPLSATVENGDTTDLFPNSAGAASSSSSTSIQEDTTTGRGIRLNKIFTKIYSRRSTETLIRDGRIRVNQDIVTDLGRRVIPYQDIVWLDDEIYSNWETHIVYDYKNTGSNIHHDDKNAAASTKQQQPPHMSSSSSNVQTNEHNDRNILVPTTIGSSEDHRLPHVYIKYWKPVGVISTTDRNVRDNLLDAIYRGCGMTSYPQHSTRPYNTHGHDLQNGRRIFNVGRLDKDTSGLLLLTSDGRVPNIVLSKQFVHTKVYQVILDKPITYEHIQQLRRGIVITTDTIRQRKHVSYTARTLPCTVEPMYHNTPRSHIPLTTLISETESSSSSTYIPTKEIQITLIEGRNRQIRVMLQSVGSYQVVQLHRIEFMSTIDLTNLHGPGDWTYLNTTEVASLEQAIASSSSSLQYNDTAIRRRSSKSLLW